MKRIVASLACLAIAALAASCGNGVRIGIGSGGLIADHNAVNAVRLGNLPVSAIQDAKARLHIAYGHTSHGSQLISGMNGLVGFANGSGCSGAYSGSQDVFAWNAGGDGGALDLRDGALAGDCGYYPDWEDTTRAYLSDPANAEVNVIIWSWCGQAAGYTREMMIERYLTPMSQFEAAYPGITFVYMTCHLDGSGADGNLNQRNEQIRDYCEANDKWLFDFADIESYDPDGTRNYMVLNAADTCNYDGGNWAQAWQNSHAQDVEWYACDSAHSEALNANMKAYAAWWLWARLAGWND
jgi:hypothetical protein